jgi:hypothetical protein
MTTAEAAWCRCALYSARRGMRWVAICWPQRGEGGGKRLLEGGCSSAFYGARSVVRLICTGRWGAGEHRGGVGGEELEHGDLSRRGGRGGQALDTLGGEQG